MRSCDHNCTATSATGRVQTETFKTTARQKKRKKKNPLRPCVQSWPGHTAQPLLVCGSEVDDDCDCWKTALNIVGNKRQRKKNKTSTKPYQPCGRVHRNITQLFNSLSLQTTQTHMQVFLLHNSSTENKPATLQPRDFKLFGQFRRNTFLQKFSLSFFKLRLQ